MNRISFNWLLHQWKTIISLYLCRSVSVGDRVRVSVSECVYIDATLLTVFANNTHPLIHFSLNSSDETFPTESHSRPSNDRVQHEDCYSNDASIHVSTERFVNLFFSTKTAFFQRDKLFLFIKLLKNIPKKKLLNFNCAYDWLQCSTRKKIYSKVDLTSENIRKRDNQFNWMAWLNVTPLLWVTSMPENAECSKLIWIKP